MRKTLKRNLSYDDRNHLSYVSLYCDGEDGRRVRRTRTYPTMEQAEQVIAEYRRAQLLGLPFLGRHLRTLDATRFASTLSILAGSGVPLLSALDAGRQVISRLPLADAVATAAERVREGQPLSRALGASRQFPPLLIHMIANGEATGKLDELLDKAARLQQQQLETRTATLTALLEPLLLVTMGAVVMFIVLAVMQPIIEINTMVK